MPTKAFIEESDIALLSLDSEHCQIRIGDTLAVMDYDAALDFVYRLTTVLSAMERQQEERKEGEKVSLIEKCLCSELEVAKLN